MSRTAPSRGRRAVWSALAVACAGLVALVLSASRDGLTYWGTPSELAVIGGEPRDVRLGGLVAPGSVEDDGATVTFVLTDGATDVSVRYAGDLPATVREGEGAVVEGVLTGQRMEARDVLLRHSNEYRPPEPAP